MNKFLTLLFFALIGNYLVAQDLNLSFEQADSMGLPNNWFIHSFPKSYFLAKDTHHGTKAVQINTSYFYVPGNLYLGDVFKQQTLTLTDLGEQGSFGLPIQHRVKNLKGWYKYEKIDTNQVNIDSGQVIILLRRYLQAEQKTIIVGQGLLNLGKADFYTEFTVPVHYVSDLIPDTISIFFSSVSNRYKLVPQGGIKKLNVPSRHCAVEFGSNCHYLTIDDLSLQFTTPTKNPITPLQKLQISPNPVHDQTIITWDIPNPAKAFDVNITDALGRTVRSIKTAQNQAEINTGDLPKGVYLVYLRQGAQLIGVERLVVAR
ncbi:T9SS type A sorting domain-containing protein [Haliscomenobacter sp.]|uniref:T9SS type A sorting domain-containing protein n=1 Tax=Haliscomenobacter sp. TaxID=2717303 RepID=UPI0035948A65